jgi:LPXTG-site transpeptidase (sortase) family protein
MQNLIQSQIEKNKSGLDHSKFTFRNQKPKDVTPNPQRKAFTLVSDYIHFAAAFILIFGSLMLYSNWSAYAVIAQDWIDTAIASPAPIASITQHQKTIIPPSKTKDSTEIDQKILASLPMYPPGTWLEIPKVFDGRVPIGKVQNPQNLNFAQDYNQTETEFQQVLQNGVLHYPNTANPDGLGNVFLTGHSSYYPWAPGEFKQIFALLHKLDAGDQFYIYYDYKKYSYEVVSKFEVKPNQTEVLKQPPDKQMATLMTCTPIGTTLNRLIIQADLVGIEG